MSRCSRTLNRRSNSVKTGQGGDGLTRYASLKREREDEEKVSKKERRVGGGRTEKALDRTKFLFVPNQNIWKSYIKEPSFSPYFLQQTSSQHTSSQHTSFRLYFSQHRASQQLPKKQDIPYRAKICFGTGHYSQKKSLLRRLFKMTSVNGKSVEDPRNFPKEPGHITWFRETGRVLKAWDHLLGAGEQKKPSQPLVLRREGPIYSPSHIIQR